MADPILKINNIEVKYHEVILVLKGVSLQVPEDSLNEYLGQFPEKPYLGDKGYVPHIAPKAAYAAMITRMDREIGRVMVLLRDLGLDKNTLVVFTSDNGPTYAGGVDAAFFKSAGPLRGLKGSVYEGGIRVPMIARWPGHIPGGSVCPYISAFWDYLPTFMELTGGEAPEDVDGISLMPVLTGKPEDQKEHDYLYWEHIRRLQAVRMGPWKGIRHRPGQPVELYNLDEDIAESRDLAAEYPDIVQQIVTIMREGRTRSEHFPLMEPDQAG